MNNCLNLVQESKPLLDYYPTEVFLIKNADILFFPWKKVSANWPVNHLNRTKSCSEKAVCPRGIRNSKVLA